MVERDEHGVMRAHAVWCVLFVLGFACFDLGQGFARPLLSELSAVQDVVTLVAQAVLPLAACAVWSRRVRSDHRAQAQTQARARTQEQTVQRDWGPRGFSAAFKIFVGCTVALGVFAQMVILLAPLLAGHVAAWSGSALCGLCFGGCYVGWVVLAAGTLGVRRGAPCLVGGLLVGRAATMVVRAFAGEQVLLVVGFAALDAGMLVLAVGCLASGLMARVCPRDLGRPFETSGRRLAPILLGAGLFSALFGLMTQVHNASRGLSPVPDQVSSIVSVLVLAALLVWVALSQRPLELAGPFLVGIPLLAAVLLAVPFFWDSYSDMADALVKSLFNLCYAAMMVYALQRCRSQGSRVAFMACVVGCIWASVAAGSAVGLALSSLTALDSAVMTAVALGAIWLCMVVAIVAARFGGRAATMGASETAVLGGEAAPVAENDDGTAVPAVVYVDRTDAQVARFAREAGLTDREREVVGMFVRGRSSARIAEDLSLSEHTVKTHLQNAYAKAGLHSRQELLDRVAAADGGEPSA